MKIEKFLKKLSKLSGCDLEFLITSGYKTYAQELIDADIDPCPYDAALYLKGALSVVEMVEEDTGTKIWVHGDILGSMQVLEDGSGIKLLEHGFTFKPSIDEGVIVSRVDTVENTPGVIKYFKNLKLKSDDLVTIQFEGDTNLFTVMVQNEELDFQATHEPSGAKCLKRLLGVK